MNDNDTFLTYAEVEAAVDAIRNYAKEMGTDFSDFGTSMNRFTSPDTFVGDASESVGQMFERLSKKFEEFVALVERYATVITDAKEQEAYNDAMMKRKAEELRTMGSN